MRQPLIQSFFALLMLPFAWGAAAAVLAAEDEVGETELELMRLQYVRSMIERSLGPLKEHMDELLQVEQALAEARDYEGAIEAQKERRRLESQLEREDKELLLLETREQSLQASLLPDVISLPLADARLDGVRRPEGSGLIDGWSRPGASAEWELPDLPSGGYEVFLRYRCGTLEGGSVLIEESRFTLSGRIQTTLKGPERRLIGTLKVTKGSGPFRLTAKTVVKDNLMQLLSVELVPSSR